MGHPGQSVSTLMYMATYIWVYHVAIASYVENLLLGGFEGHPDHSTNKEKSGT